jgi:hypothetical protein
MGLADDIPSTCGGVHSLNELEPLLQRFSAKRHANFLDALFSKAYNFSHSGVVRVSEPDREGCDRWKHPQGNSAEVAWSE